MSEEVNGNRRRGAIITVIVVVIAIAAAAIVFAMVQGAAKSSDRAATASPTTSVGPEGSGQDETPDPESTTLPSATAGATDPVEKPAATEEVPLADPVVVAKDYTVTVDGITAVEAGLDAPGEKRGPAVRVPVTITNGGSEPVDLGGSNVSLTYGGDERIPAISVTDTETSIWPVVLQPGETATAVFFFAVPADAPGDVRVIVDLLASEPDVVFVGSRP